MQTRHPPRPSSPPCCPATQSSAGHPPRQPVATMRVAIGRPDGRDGSDRKAAFYDIEVRGKRAETAPATSGKGRRSRP